MDQVLELTGTQKLLTSHGEGDSAYQKAALNEGDLQLVAEANVEAGFEINVALIVVILSGNIILLLA